MTDALDQPKTALGQVDQHLAAAACYVPFFMINYIAPVLFLVMEPKEHREVRFHAVQSLGVTAVWLFSIFVAFMGMFLVPIFFMVIGAAVGMEDVGGVIGGLLYMLMAVVVILLSLAGPALYILLAIFCAIEKDPRVPVLASLADRVVGPAA